MVTTLESMYMLFDNEGKPLPSTLRYHRKNSIATLEAKEWELRQSQGWICKKVELKITEL